MRCALAAVGFINEDLNHNKNVIINTMQKYAKTADIVIFGEAFLQGFYAVTFDLKHDEKIAISKFDWAIRDICLATKENQIAVSFGFIEKEGTKFYSSQITIDHTGKVIDLFRRVSPGWKEPFASVEYCEGETFHRFEYLDKNIVVGLCGDLWFDDFVEKVKQLKPDVVFWPVYTDFNFDKWNTSIKCEYANQTKKISHQVLYINSYCKDKLGDKIAQGGAIFYEKGSIKKEVLASQETVLLVEI